MTRILSALVLGGLTVVVVLFAPLVVAAVPLAFLSSVGALEMAGLLNRTGTVPNRPALVAGSILVTIGVVAGGSIHGAARDLGPLIGLNAFFLAAAALVIAVPVLQGRITGAGEAVSSSIVALVFPVWSLSHALLFLCGEAKARHSLLFALAIVWACDIAAYYGGTTLGRIKLSPHVSPNKTMEGLAAGLLGGGVVAAALRPFLLPDFSLSFALSAGLILSAVGQFGDLSESLIKRSAGVKDSGSIIPGHGGVLDRIDALLFTVPLFYYVLLLADAAMWR